MNQIMRLMEIPIVLDLQKKARSSLKQKSPRLFANCSVYFYGKFTTPTKEELQSIISTGQGTVLTDLPKPAKNTADMLSNSTNNLVIMDPTTTSIDDAKEIYFKTTKAPVEFSWVLDSISNYQLVDMDKYKMTTHEAPFETQNSLAY